MLNRFKKLAALSANLKQSRLVHLPTITPTKVIGATLAGGLLFFNEKRMGLSKSIHDLDSASSNQIPPWKRSDCENTPFEPEKVYLIKGGNEESRKERIYELTRGEGSMYSIYYKGDESAVVFSDSHDLHDVMNFELAKKFAGQKQLPENFSTILKSLHEESSFGVITINDEPESVLRPRR